MPLRDAAQLGRNFAALSAYQVVLRTGWIFKTESIVVPAVLDSIAGSGWVRGWLPLLNRVGHSLPPLLLAHRVTITPLKKWILLSSAAVMSACFLGLAALFSARAAHPPGWLPLVFLVFYAAFFVAVGVNQLAFGTLQGKLIPVARRGRLLWVSNTVGSVVAIFCAVLLMPRWLRDEAPRFDLIFGFSGVLFGTAACTALGLAEPRDSFQQAAMAAWRRCGQACALFHHDSPFRLLALAGALFSVSIMLFPHYQNLGLASMRLKLTQLLWWVVVQNVGTGLFSIPAGAIADRWGNRRVLQLTLLGIAAAPAVAIGLSHAGAPGRAAFPLVFVLVGLTPVVYRTFQNFALELSAADEHPRYLAALGLCMAAPILLSPLVGLCVDRLGFEIVFLVIAGVVLVGWLLTFRLAEPRQHVIGGLLATDE